MTDQNEKDPGYDPGVKFLRALARAETLADMNVAAGIFLQDLGEEPSDDRT